MTPVNYVDLRQSWHVYELAEKYALQNGSTK